MANSVHLPPKDKMRNNKQKAEQRILIKSAKYINDFNIAISFTSGKTKIIDFLPLFHKYVKGEYLDYFNPQKFKKFTVEHGNIFWG
jgi:hypothetical protein